LILKSIVSTFFLATLLLTLIYLSLITFDDENIILLAIALTLFASSGFSLGLFILSRHYREISLLEVSNIALFTAFLFTTNYFAMLIPSLIYYILPAAAGITFYFPASIFYGTFKKMCSRPGSSLLLLIGYGIVSEIFSPAIFWIPYYLAWGGFLEVHLALSKDEEEIGFCHGFIFGLYGAGLALLYMLVAWGVYRPIFMALPAVIIDGLLSALGFKIGENIGRHIKSLQL